MLGFGDALGFTENQRLPPQRLPRGAGGLGLPPGGAGKRLGALNALPDASHTGSTNWLIKHWLQV